MVKVHTRQLSEVAAFLSPIEFTLCPIFYSKRDSQITRYMLVILHAINPSHALSVPIFFVLLA